MGIIEFFSGIVEAAKAVVEAIAPAVQKLLTVVANALLSLCKALDLVKPQTQATDLGDKAIQSGFDPDDFESYGDYVKACEDFEDLDPEKSAQISEEEKTKKGMELAAGAVIEKFDDLPMEDFLVEAENNPEFFTEAVMKEFGKLFDEDPEKISEIMAYIDGTEKNIEKKQSAFDTLSEIVKTTEPEISDEDVKDRIFAIRK